MQDTIITSHTFLVDMHVNSNKPVEMCIMTWNKLQIDVTLIFKA